MTLAVQFPLRLVSEANTREFHLLKARRVREQRQLARMVCTQMARDVMAVLSRMPGGHHVRIVITRLAPRALDSDNLASSAKAVRDGIADALQSNDRNPLFVWGYSQRKHTSYAVRVSFHLVEARSSAPPLGVHPSRPLPHRHEGHSPHSAGRLRGAKP